MKLSHRRPWDNRQFLQHQRTIILFSSMYEASFVILLLTGGGLRHGGMLHVNFSTMKYAEDTLWSFSGYEPAYSSFKAVIYEHSQIKIWALTDKMTTTNSFTSPSDTVLVARYFLFRLKSSLKKCFSDRYFKANIVYMIYSCLLLHIDLNIGRESASDTMYTFLGYVHILNGR